MQLLLILGSVLAAPVVPDYRLLFGRYAGAAKCDSIYSQQAWNCGPICEGDLVAKTKVIYAIIDETIDGAVQVTRNDDLKLIVISFRGTRSSANWLQNLKFWKSSPDWKAICGDVENCDAKTNINSTQNGKTKGKSRMIPLKTVGNAASNVLPTNIYVHAGFEGQYLRLRDINPLVKAQADEFADYKIICTGHSLGGAMAHLSAADLTDLYGLGERISIYTFGQPRVGDQAWAEYLANLPFGSRIFRYAIRGDPVVQVPPRVLGYRHSRYQWMVNMNGTITSCSYEPGKFESEECIWGVGENDVKLHGKYDFGGSCT